MRRREIRRAKRIIILCEGRTEMIAVEHFVNRRWNAEGLKSIALHPINLKAKLDDVFHNVMIFRKNPKVIAVFTLIDLYGINRVEHNPDHSLEQKVEAVRAWLRNLFDDDLLGFFHPHVSVHEVEAWLLADGQCIDNSIKPDPNAEQKDFQNPPKARIDKILRKLRRGDGYREVKDGTSMFKKARFDIVYQSCPYFKRFYDDLKNVAQKELNNPDGLRPKPQIS